MLRAVRSSLASFRPVAFTPGLNIVLATRTTESSDKDSVNGLGKSTLLDIIHYCLGSNPDLGRGIFSPELKEESFEIEFELDGRVYTARRSLARNSKILVEGDFSNWPVQPKQNRRGESEYSQADWCDCLGIKWFGLPPEDPERKFAPTFRSLISYVVRRYDAYQSAFQQYPQQLTWDIQVNTAYLLRLSWEDASRLQVLRETDRQLRALKGASNSGVLAGVLGSRGELEAKRVRLEEGIKLREGDLRRFQVLPQYREIETKADELTDRIHESFNRSTELKQILRYYENSLRQERQPEVARVLQLFREAQVELSPAAIKRLDQVQAFHAAVVTNRRAFLEDEVRRIQRNLTEIEIDLVRSSTRRAELLSLLSEHRALDELTALQAAHQREVAELATISSRLEGLVKVDEGVSRLRIEREEVLLQAQRNFTSTEEARRKVISQFNENSRRMYDAPGDLLIEVGPSGFKFGIRIEGSGSTGREHMNIFCYDLMVAQLWADRKSGPRFLIHDSTIFDGVDHRQSAAALELAASETDKRGFQYITAINADSLPNTDFSPGFDCQRFIRVELTDARPDGGLLGIRLSRESHPPSEEAPPG